MEITVREPSEGDVESLSELYGRLEAEMTDLRPAWRLVDGLAQPTGEAIAELLNDPTWHCYLADIDGVPVGFLFSHDEALLPQADGQRMGSIRFIFTDADAREVGVGEALIGRFLEDARRRGVAMFDAHVSPGQRMTKNFFEANGFKARSIVMHRRDP